LLNFKSLLILKWLVKAKTRNVKNKKGAAESLIKFLQDRSIKFSAFSIVNQKNKTFKMKNLYILLAFFLLGSVTHLTYAQAENDSTNRVYEFFEITEAPQFIGGFEEMNKFLSSQIIYPKEALDNSIEGTVVVKIIVEKDGSITYIAIVRNPGGGLGEEGERVVKLMPKWKPAIKKICL